MTRLTPEQVRANKIDRTVQRYKCLRIGKCVKDTAAKFQEMIRVESLGPDGKAMCVSCKRRFPLGNGLDAGHWIGRSKTATIFDERNCHPQCSQCNQFDSDGTAKVRYNVFMLNTYGQKVMDELVRLGNETKQFTREELAELRQGFMDRIAAAKERMTDG